MDFSVLMTVAVPVLPCTTLSQQAMPATLLSNPVVCRIPGGRTVFSFQFCGGYISAPLLNNPPKEVQKTTSIEKYILFLPVAHKRKSAAQNRTRTTNCPNSVSYGAWKIFSPYGSCSACTVRNRFSVFSFSSEDFFTTPPDNMIVTALFQKSKNYVFHLDPKSKFLDLA